MLRAALFALLAMFATIGLSQDGLTPQEKALWKAMSSENLSSLRKILDDGFDVSKQTSDGSTPLHWAAGAWVPLENDVIPLLLSHGAKIDQLDSEGRTPLMIAADGFNVEATKLLIANGADVKAKDRYGNHAIHHCVTWTQWDLIIGGREESCAQVIRLLVAAGEDVNVKNDRGATPLICAAGHWHLPSVMALIDLKADLDAKDDHGSKAITWPALCQPDGEIYKALLRAGTKLGFLEYLALGDDQKAMETMPEKDVDHYRYVDGRTALMVAARQGNVELVQKLLERGAKVNRSTEGKATALHYATGTEYHQGQLGRIWQPQIKPKAAPKIISLLLQKGANLEAKDDFEETPLGWALNVSDEGGALELLHLGANPHSKGFYGYTALETSVRNGLPRIVEAILAKLTPQRRAEEWDAFDAAVSHHKQAPHYLGMFLKAGFSPNLIYPKRGSPLITAAEEGDLNAATELVTAGAKVKAHDKEGHTAIMEAKTWDVFKFLLDKGARPLEVAPDGYSALFASDNRTLAFLLKKGLNPNQRLNAKSTWKPGLTALIRAAWKGDIERAKLLLDHGADISLKDSQGEDAFSISKESDPKMYAFLKSYKKKKGRS